MTGKVLEASAVVFLIFASFVALSAFGKAPAPAQYHPPAEIYPQGSGSGLDADLLDGNSTTKNPAATSGIPVIDASITYASLRAGYASGAGNADTVDGYHAADLLAAGGGTPISSVDSSIGVAPNSYAYVDIRPPVGETWRIKLTIGGVTGSSHIMEVRAYKYNGAAQTGGQIYWPGNTPTPGAYGEFEITNSNYLKLVFYASAGGGTGYYSYFGNRM